MVVRCTSSGITECHSNLIVDKEFYSVEYDMEPLCILLT